jgi:hypothetical protein
MTAERLRQGVQKLFQNVVAPFLPLKDVLYVPLLCLEEDDSREVELAGKSRSFIMSSFYFYLWRMYFVSLPCVSKRMTAKRLNWQGVQKLF